MNVISKLTLQSVMALIIMATISIDSAQGNELPTETLQRFALDLQVPAMKNHDIRARKIIVPAGTKIRQHQHSTTPGIVYLVSGSIIECRGDKERILQSGDTLREDVDTVHSYFNSSSKDCVLIAIDLPKTK